MDHLNASKENAIMAIDTKTGESFLQFVVHIKILSFLALVT